MLRLFDLTSAVLLSLCLGQIVSAQEDAVAKRYALVVGVHKYRAGQDLPPLPFAESDAVELSEVLGTGGYKVTVLTQATARVEGKELLAPNADFIRDQLKAVLENPFLKRNDTVLIALAGHGVQFEFVAGEKKTSRFYFCPADTDIKGVRTANEIGDRHHLISLEELYAGLDESKAGVKLMFVDACRDDPTRSGVARSTQSVTLPRIPPPPGGIAAFFSCSANQKAFENAELKHGVFFHYVIDGLKGAADTATDQKEKDGVITLAELHEHVAGSVYDFVQEKYPGHQQAPELKGEFRNRVAVISRPTWKFGGRDAGEERSDNSLKMQFCWCPPGTFIMGSPPTENGHIDEEGKSEKQRPIELTNGVWIGKYEVTQGEWRDLIGESFEQHLKNIGKKDLEIDRFGIGDKFPMAYVNTKDADSFCLRLTEKERKAHRLARGFAYRLPTQAEWEYACRARTTTATAFGDSLSRSQANIGSDYTQSSKVPESINSDSRSVKLVGSYAPNAWGLFDMHGNVSEWCADFAHWHPMNRQNPFVRHPDQESLCREYRGGNFQTNGINARSAAGPYGCFPPDGHNPGMGLRIALGPEIVAP